ncbi:MFS transporter [Aliikangiella maris]|uniref:MFS transporter n=2 Tax=Aliikangiella maris TaxID=3162458 RepID=A0ABV2BPY2_9GAMM
MKYSILLGNATLPPCAGYAIILCISNLIQNNTIKRFTQSITQHKITTLLVIIIAGELIFSLPFHIPRFFRPTFLQVFELSNTELGDIFALYGIVAMLSYFPSGILTDRFAPQKLMFYSLVATAAGGVYLATIPPKSSLYFLFAYWGCTSILLFWSAMIKQTWAIAGHHLQGTAFGILDGGRGLVASLAASIAIIILSDALLPATTRQSAISLSESQIAARHALQ